MCLFIFWILNSLPFVYMFIFMIVPHCFAYYSFVVNFEIGNCESYNIGPLFLKILLIAWNSIAMA
jgi:hypothetical protein